jgi:hypothetical protein
VTSKLALVSFHLHPRVQQPGPVRFAAAVTATLESLMSITVSREFSKLIFVVLLVRSLPAIAQDPAPTPVAAPPARVFVFFQRTDAHGKYSKSEVFHAAMDDALAFLKEKNVAMAVDEFGGRSYAESATPLDTVFKIARDSGATSVLYIVVDRPVSKWVKITAQCMDLDQKPLWKEEASNGASMSGGDALKSTEKKFREKLDPHLGRDGLPVVPAVSNK